MDNSVVLEALGRLHKEIDLWASNHALAIESQEKAEKQEAEMRKAYEQREGYIAELEDLLTRERAKNKAYADAMKADLMGMLKQED